QPTVSFCTSLAVAATSTDVSCFGGSNGSATASVSGGVTPYTFSWNTSPVQTGATASGLSAGTYIVTVTDANGCQGTKLVTISQPASALAASAVATNAACFGGNGSVLVSASGGTAPYSGTGTISKAAGSY